MRKAAHRWLLENVFPDPQTRFDMESQTNSSGVQTSQNEHKEKGQKTSSCQNPAAIAGRQRDQYKLVNGFYE